MTSRSFLLTSAVCLLPFVAVAQQAPPVAGGGRGAGRGQTVSPEVRADGTITFRFNAPNAREVTLIGELDGKTHPMSRNGAGVWEVTSQTVRNGLESARTSRTSANCTGAPPSSARATP